MKSLRISFYMGLLLLVLLAACGPNSQPITAVPPTATLVPVAIQAAPTATLVPVALAGPEMKVGSTYPYVDGTLLVAVPGGPFTMGRGGQDNPQHTVNVGDFWIYSTKVTNQQYAFCVGLGQCTPPDLQDNQGYNDPSRSNFPVVGVKWAQAQAYCTFVHGTLPTEAQWEKTARGPNGNIYPWGNNAPICDVLNFNNCVGKTTTVIKYPQGASYYSALDMEGNTFEWVADWYDPLYYKNGPAQDPLGPDSGLARSVRSASYKANSDQVQAAVRFKLNPGEHHRDLGFRCVVADPTYFAPFCQTMVDYGKSASGGNTSGGSGSQCQPAKIVAFEDCATGNTPVNNVHLEASPPTRITGVTVSANGSDASGLCKPAFTGLGDTSTHVCPLGLTITITAACDVSPQTADAASCPSNIYTLSPDGKTCTAKGSPGQCLPGYSYDPALMCCSAVPGNASKICSTGFHEYQGACVSDGSGLYNVAGDLVVTQSGKTCTPGGGSSGCTNASQYGDAKSCAAAGCTWVYSITREGGSCH